VIPKGSSRDDLIKLIEKAGYMIDHEKKAIKPKVQRGKQITLSQAEKLTKPKPKTELQKQKAQEKKAEKEAMKKKQEREIRKKAVEEERARQKKPKTKPAKKTTTIGTRPKGIRVDTSASAKGTDMTKKEVKKPSPAKKEVKKPPVKKQVLRGGDTKDKDILNDIISNWGKDVNNVVIQQNLKKLNNGIISLWDTNKKYINIDGIFQFNKSLFNELFMKYPAQKVIDGLEKFMLYTTDSSDYKRIGQNEFKNWFEVRDGRTQSNIRGKDLNVSVLTKLQKEWENKFLKKKEEKKPPPAKKEEEKPPPAKKEEKKDNNDFNELMKKISLPLQYLKEAKPRKEAMTQVSTLLLDKNISYAMFQDIIDNLELYHDQISLIGGFSFKKGEAPPRWRMPLSKMVRDAFNSNDKKKDWKAWTDRLPKKGVKLAPSSNEVDEKVLKLLEDGKKLLETFLKENKGFEKKDYTNLKNKKSYHESLKNYDNFVKGYNSIISAINKKSTTPEIEKKVNEYREKSGKIRNTIEAIYKYRKTPNKMGKLTLSF
jgi:hypothetical protein